MADKEALDNPAGRLLQLLNDARRRTSGVTVRTCWKEVLGPVTGDKDLILRMFAVQQLFDEVEERLRTAVPKINEELYIAPLSRLRKAVYIGSLDADWKEYVVHLSEVDVRSLSFAADRLSEFGPDPFVSEDVLTDILKDVQELYEDVLNSDLPKPLLRLLAEQLQEILRAIHLYRVGGLGPIRKALAKTLGLIYEQEEAVREKKGESELSRFGSILQRLDQVVSVAAKAKPLIGPTVEFIRPLLPGG